MTRKLIGYALSLGDAVAPSSFRTRGEASDAAEVEANKRGGVVTKDSDNDLGFVLTTWSCKDGSKLVVGPVFSYEDQDDFGGGF